MANSFKYLVREGFRNMWVNRLMSFASIGVLICCLVLMGSASLVSVNISGIMGWLGEQNVVMVFMDQSFDGSAQSVATASETLRKIGNIKDINFVPREEAYKSIIGRMGGNYELIMSIDDTGEFLPDAFTVTFEDLTRFEETVMLIQQMPGVYTVSNKADLVAKLRGINRTVTVIGVWIVGLLFLVSLFIITNTLKLTMYVRRLEISIMKSVGATDGFIRLPFLIEGVIIGMISGLVSFGIISYVYLTAVSAVTSISAFGVIAYSKVWLQCLLGFLGAGILAGISGSLFSIRKYLHSEGGISSASI